MKGRDTEAWIYLIWANPPGDYRDLGAGQGRQRGERTVTGNGGRRRHAARGSGPRDRGSRGASIGDVQVGSDSHQERRWVAGVPREGPNK